MKSEGKFNTIEGWQKLLWSLWSVNNICTENFDGDFVENALVFIMNIIELKG